MPYYSRTQDEYARFRAEVAKEEARDFVERELKCPECGYLVGFAFSDAKGHLKIRCKKCKTVSVLNFAYFYRNKYRRRKNNCYLPLR